MDPVTIAHLERIEAKLDRLIGGPPAEVINGREVMLLTGDRSVAALHRTLTLLGIRPYKRGRYRRQEVINAVARRALEHRLAETQTEGRIHSLSAKPNIHE